MPSAQSFTNYLDGLREKVLRRADQRDTAAKTLPPDFSGQVFNRARELAAEIDARAAQLEPLIAETREAMQAAEKQVASTRVPILSGPKRRGDILSGFSIEPGKPTGALITKETLEARAKLVTPLRRRLEALEREKWLLQQERGQLRKIAERAAAGDVSLVHFLSDHWRSRLLIGPAVLGKLPPAARALLGTVLYTDAAGVPLPAEALDEEGRPDLPPAGRVPR